MAATIGLPLETVFGRLSALGVEGSSRAAAAYRAIFSTLDMANVRPFPEMPKLLRHCGEAGFTLAVASSRGQGEAPPGDAPS